MVRVNFNIPVEVESDQANVEEWDDDVIVENARDILYGAPAFDWFPDEMVDELEVTEVDR